MHYKEHNNFMLLLINLINDTPIANSVPKVSRERPFQSLRTYPKNGYNWTREVNK